MKKCFIAVFTALVLLCGCLLGANVTTNAESTTANISSFVQEYCNCCKNYDGQTEEISPAMYLKNTFTFMLGESNANYEYSEMPFDSDGDGKNDGLNLVFTVNPTAEEKVILGAHYDTANGEGASDNATGVATLFFTLKSLVEYNCNCCLTVVLFDKEENGMQGSYAFVDQMSQSDRDSTLCMINFDCVGGGDNLYVMCENKHTSLANLFLQHSKYKSIPLLEKPYAKGISNLDLYGYGYYEKVQDSDHTPFRMAGIPTVFFFSGTFDGWQGYTQSADKNKVVMNTLQDTYENLCNNSDFALQIKTVSATVAETIIAEDFVPTATNARKELVNNSVWFSTIIPRVVLAVLFVVMLLLYLSAYKKLQKQAILGDNGAKEKVSLFTKPDAEDIFSFGTDEKDKSDDIFKF